MEAGECLAPIAHHRYSAVTAVEALAMPAGTRGAIHQFWTKAGARHRPPHGSFYIELTRMTRANLSASGPIAEATPSVLSAHGPSEIRNESWTIDTRRGKLAHLFIDKTPNGGECLPGEAFQRYSTPILSGELRTS
jgi:hypothetical protein